MTYEQVWEATKSSILVTWCVLFSYALTVFLNAAEVVEIGIPFEPATITYFFGVFQSSVFAVFYVNKVDWRYYLRDRSKDVESPSEL
jgi:hypothetical protein